MKCFINNPNSVLLCGRKLNFSIQTLAGKLVVTCAYRKQVDEFLLCVKISIELLRVRNERYVKHFTRNKTKILGAVKISISAPKRRKTH